ncbi:DUF4209 domain-containing protein [Cupriavidus sp. CuC1]|uniref:DUF4209 domain-containing protein n=1 Tax=Cupriavidus sp. CuC1 TaxID=3373131 RepID=UPI0037D783E9
MALPLPQSLIAILAAYDSSLEPIGEIGVSGKLLEAMPSPELLTSAELRAAHAEISALRFCPRHGTQPGRWGIYWQELTSAVSADGSEVVFPDIAKIDEEILAYWIERSEQARHPVLLARYADLSWEIGCYLRAEAKRQNISMECEIPVVLCQRAIDAYLETINGSLFQSEPDAWIYLDRAIELAIRIADKVRKARTKDILYALYRRHDAAGQPWMWWKFNELVSKHGKRLELSPQERQETIDLLERTLAECSNSADPKHFDPHNAMSAADCLERWRAQTNELGEARRAMKAAALAFEEAAKHAGGMTAIAWLEDLIPRYRQAGMLDDSARVEQTIRQRAADAQAEMGTVGTSVDISKEEIEQWVAQFLTGSVADALAGVAREFLIREDATKIGLRDMCANAPLLSMMSSSIVNADGFTTATVGSVERDLDGRALQHAARLLDWNARWLHFALTRIHETYALTAEGLIAVVQECSFFAPEHLPLLHDGVAAWFAGDPIKAIHLLVPQIEAALRNLLAALGGAVMVPNTDVGGFKAASLGEILNHAIFVEKASPDIRFHLRAMYNDPRGLNLRNELAHGLVRPELLNMGLANWVVHTVVLISLLRVKSA